MDLFKFVFTDDPGPPNLYQTQKSSQPTTPPDQEEHTLREIDSSSNPIPESSISGGTWSLGGLLKTVASKSETVIQTYRRDLEEFGSGLKMETAAIREAASRTVKDLPVSIEAGASVAQGSLESVGKAIDGIGSSVWRGTTEILSNSSKYAVVSADGEIDSSNRFSRFEIQVHAVQTDLSTYCEEPDDLDEFGRWKLGFVMEEKAEEIESLIGEKGVMGEVYAKLVPSVIDDEIFWSRYFYRIYKLKQAEEARANLVKRVVSGEEEEENWSWDFEDDEKNGEEPPELAMEKQRKVVDGETDGVEAPVVQSKPDNESAEKVLSLEKNGDLSELNCGELEETEPLQFTKEKQKNVVDSEVGDSEAPVAESSLDNGSGEKVEDQSELNGGELVTKLSDEEDLERKTGESCKVSVLSLPEEEDIGWDEIEDLGSDNEKKVDAGGSSNRADLRRRLSVADEEEDLSWDIEDDDDVPVKH